MKRTRTTYSKTPMKKQKTSKSMVVYKQPTNPIRLIKRGADLGVLAADPNVNVYFGRSFALNQVAGYTELTALFDQYKISAVELTFIPRYSQITPFTTAPDNIKCFIATDYNDNAAPTSIDQVREYEDYKFYSSCEKFTHYIDKPKILDNSSTSRTAWISTASASTSHYGFKFACEPFGLGGTYGWSVEACFYLAFKNVK